MEQQGLTEEEVCVSLIAFPVESFRHSMVSVMFTEEALLAMSC